MILLTAFEPFGKNDRNISQEVLKSIPQNDELMTFCLPVSFSKGPEFLKKYLKEYCPEKVIMLGQTSSGDTLRLERYSHNLMDSVQPDNDDFVPNEIRIYQNAPIAYETKVPVKNLAQECLKEGFHVKVSNSAGLFVCNRVYYECLHQGFNGVFVHIPKNFNLSEATQAVLFICKYLSNDV